MQAIEKNIWIIRGIESKEFAGKQKKEREEKTSAGSKVAIET